MKLIGRPGVEMSLRSTSRSPTKYLGFLKNKGAVLRVTQVGDGHSFIGSSSAAGGAAGRAGYVGSRCWGQQQQWPVTSCCGGGGPADHSESPPSFLDPPFYSSL